MKLHRMLSIAVLLTLLTTITQSAAQTPTAARLKAELRFGADFASDHPTLGVDVVFDILSGLAYPAAAGCFRGSQLDETATFSIELSDHPGEFDRPLSTNYKELHTGSGNASLHEPLPVTFGDGDSEIDGWAFVRVKCSFSADGGTTIVFGDAREILYIPASFLFEDGGPQQFGTAETVLAVNRVGSFDERLAPLVPGGILKVAVSSRSGTVDLRGAKCSFLYWPNSSTRSPAALWPAASDVYPGDQVEITIPDNSSGDAIAVQAECHTPDGRFHSFIEEFLIN